MRNEKSDFKVLKYVKVKNTILERIKSGELLPNSQVPSESEIASAFDVSSITARKALSDLVHEGYVYRIRGKGTFVHCSKSSKKQDSKVKMVTFVILSDQASDGSLMRIIVGAQSFLSASGYSMVVECSSNNILTERMILKKCIDEMHTGILVFSVDPSVNRDCFEKFHELGIPFVMIDRSAEELSCNHVSSYNLDGAFKIADYLISLGHTKIAYASVDIGLETERIRYEGYKLALKKAGIKEEENFLVTDSFNNLEQMHYLINTESVTAIMCVNDACASAVVNFLKSSGVNIPGEVSVTGFDDNDFIQFLTPSLTTVRQSFSEMGKVAAEILVNSIENKNLGCKRVLLPTELVFRESTGNAKNVLIKNKQIV